MFTDMNRYRNLPSILSGMLLFGLSSTVNAATTWIDDSNSDGIGGSTYEITKMRVDWDSSNNVNVKIYTGFAGHASDGTDNNHDNIGYGDLLIGTNPNFSPAGNLNPNEGTNWTDNGTTWDYAFMLDQNDYNYDGARHNHGDQFNKPGYLVAFNDGRDTYNEKNTASDWWSGAVGQDREDEVVTSAFYDRQTTVLDEGLWSANKSDDYLSFSFNIGALGLQNPSQLAFRWAITCANDIISGVANGPGGGNQVPEPAVLTLMLAGLAGFGFTRRRRKSDCLAA